MNLDKYGFENWMILKKLSANTIKNYLYYLDKFKLYESFNQECVNDFLLKYNQQIARAFINNYRQFVNESNSELDKEEIRNIVMPKITGRKKQRIPKTLTKLEVFAMEREMTSERNKIMLLITFYGGLRVSGLLNVKPLDFLWKKWNQDQTKNLELRVIEKGDKERIVFIPKEVAFRIKDWIRNVASKKDPNPDHVLFNVKLRHWEKIIEKSSNKALGFRINPHILRHSCATWLLENDWNIKEVQEYLGHESIQTTEIYLHINKDELSNKFNA